MATLRSATCIVGGDTGPLHLAIALGTPAVALFGPTDPARNGPYRNPPCIGTNEPEARDTDPCDGDIVLRAPNSVTSHSRNNQTDPSMLAIEVDGFQSAAAGGSARFHERSAFLRAVARAAGVSAGNRRARFRASKPPSIVWGALVGVIGLLIRRRPPAICTSRRTSRSADLTHIREILSISAARFSHSARPSRSYSWISALVLCGYFALFYSIVMRREEGELRVHHGAAFDEYAKAVPLFFPRITPRK